MFALKGFTSALVVLCAITLALAQRPETLCTGAGNSPGFVNEGAYVDFISSAPSGYRVSIHTIGWVFGSVVLRGTMWRQFPF